MHRLATTSIATLIAAAALAGCGATSGSSGASSPTASVSSPACPTGAFAEYSVPASCFGRPSPASTTKLTVGLGYIPSVQFAQFYLADQAGYYRDAGVEVTFQNKIDADLVPSVGAGSVDLGIADGTSVIPAVSQGIPIRYVATIYGTFPSIVFAKATSGIKSVADLKGKRIGTPGKFGSSWIMLQALLASAGLTTADVQVVLFPDFGQLAALQKGAVDAATGFANNEPVLLERGGEKATVLHVDAATPLPGPGIIAATQTIAAKGAALRAFIKATLRAEDEIRRDPARGMDAAVARVPELGKDAATRDAQLAILNATVATWSSPYTDAHALGAIDRDAWTRSVAFMTSLPDKPVARPVAVDELVTEDLLHD